MNPFLKKALIVLAINSQRGSVAKAVMVAIATLVAITLAIVLTAFLGGRARPRGAVARNGLRVLAVAIESYSLQYSAFPPWSALPKENLFSIKDDRDRTLYGRMPTFRVGTEHAIMQSDMAGYDGTLPTDPYSSRGDEPYAYWSNAVLAIAWSPGPDGVFDLTMDNIEEACDPSKPFPSDKLLALAYDPDNGMKSKGDMYRLLSCTGDLTVNRDRLPQYARGDTQSAP